MKSKDLTIKPGFFIDIKSPAEKSNPGPKGFGQAESIQRGFLFGGKS